MSKMPCHITDGPQEPDDIPGYEEPDEDAAYEAHRQRCIDDGLCQFCMTDLVDGRCPECSAKVRHADCHTKIGQYTGTTLYSYDQAYWWSTEETAWRMIQKLQGTNHD